jgi:hypothetical protein
VCGRSDACGLNDRAAFSRRMISSSEKRNGFRRRGPASNVALADNRNFLARNPVVIKTDPLILAC